MTNHPNRSQLRPGERVRSKPIGTKPAFDGVIKERLCGSHGVYYHVEDADGNLWTRVSSELERVHP